MRKRKKERLCKECGCDISLRALNAIYCKKCARKREERRRKKNYERWKKKHLDYQREYWKKIKSS